MNELKTIDSDSEYSIKWRLVCEEAAVALINQEKENPLSSSNMLSPSDGESSSDSIEYWHRILQYRPNLFLLLSINCLYSN